MNPRRDWQRFWFDPIGGTSLGVFRFFFGLNCLVFAALLFPDRVFWFTDSGPITWSASNYLNGLHNAGPRPLSFIGPHVGVVGITVFFLLFMLFSVTLSLGFCTRLSSILIWIGLNSLHNRNNELMNGSDSVFVIMAFYLMLAPAGASFSIDHLIRVLRGKNTPLSTRIVPWAQRLMQLQICVLYLSSALIKCTGDLWQSGKAVYYPLNYPELRRFPIMPLSGGDVLLINLLTYGTLAIEFALAFLVWNPRMRLYVLTGGVLLHLGIEYTLNIPLFAAVMINCYILFLIDDDWNKLKAWLARKFAAKRLVVRSSETFNPLALEFLKTLDVVRLITFEDKAVPREDEATLWAEDSRGRQYLGPLAAREMVSRMPLLWKLRLISWFPGGIRFWGNRFQTWLLAIGTTAAVGADMEPSLR